MHIAKRMVTLLSKKRVNPAQWIGSIGCRVSFFMIAALLLIAAMIGACFYLEAQKKLDNDIRESASNAAQKLAVLAANDLASGRSKNLVRILSSFFIAHESVPTESIYRYVLFYDRNRTVVAGRWNSGLPSDSQETLVDSQPQPSLRGLKLLLAFLASLKSYPAAALIGAGIYDINLPVEVHGQHVGYVRVGVSGYSESNRYSVTVKRATVAVLIILLVGFAFSQIITYGITRRIKKLGVAAKQVVNQNWDASFPEEGTDEISHLGRVCNQMTQTLKLREESLSQGNRDLFMLHTAGLDLMESIDRNALVCKIAERVEELIRADTTAVSGIDHATRMLVYWGAYGSKARALAARETPVESAGIYNWLASYGTPVHIVDTQSDPLVDAECMRTLGIRSIIAVPLWSANSLIGILTAFNKKGAAFFDKHDLRLLTVFANLAAAALQNSLLYSDLKNSMDEIKTAHEQLIRSTKLAAIGELSTNLAHEINNPLTSVLGYTTHLLKTLDLGEPSRRMLGMVEQETLRVRKIIRNLLDFARQRPAWMQCQDIAAPLRETVALVQGIAGASSVLIRESYPDQPVLVNIDHNEMKQVFINIVNNALHAMQGGGELSIRLREAGDNTAVVEFEDTGIGIAPEHLQKIFEPFFSTKDNGDGTGLGLSISYRIVQQHGGRIEVESTSGHGALFRLILPLSQDDGSRSALPGDLSQTLMLRRQRHGSA